MPRDPQGRALNGMRACTNCQFAERAPVVGSPPAGCIPVWSTWQCHWQPVVVDVSGAHWCGQFSPVENWKEKA